MTRSFRFLLLSVPGCCMLSFLPVASAAPLTLRDLGPVATTVAGDKSRYIAGTEMPGSLSAALLLAAPFGGIGGVPLTSPVVVSGAPATLLWSGSSQSAPREVEVYGRQLDGSANAGAEVRLTRAGEDGDAATTAGLPAGLRLADGRVLLSYSQRRRVAGRTYRTIRVRLVDPAGPRFGPDRPISTTRLLRGAASSLDSAPALAWGLGRRSALVTWVEQTRAGARVLARRISAAGAPLGPTITLDSQATGNRRLDPYGAAWTAPAPSVASTASGQVVVWSHGVSPGAQLRARTVRADGHARPYRLSLSDAAQRRLLSAGRGPIAETGPALLRRPSGHLVLAWTSTGPPTEPGLSPLDAVMVTALKPTAAIRRVTDLDLEFETARVDANLVNTSDGGLAVSWLFVLTGYGRSGGGSAPQVRRLTAQLAPIGPITQLSTGEDPSAPPVYSDANAATYPAQPLAATLGTSGPSLLAAWPIKPYIVGRVVP